MLNGIIIAASSYTNSTTDNVWLKLLVKSETNAQIIHYPLGAVPEEIRDEVEDKPSILKGSEFYFEFLPVGAKLAGSSKPVETADKFIDLSKSMLVPAF
jgi:hypothetical protein